MNLIRLNSVKSFLLDNRTVRQTIYKNTLWLIVGMGVNRALKAVLVIYVARMLGATEYGKFAFALAFVGLFSIIYDFGISMMIVREFSREPEQDFSSIISLRIILGLVAYAVMIIGSLIVTEDVTIRKIMFVLGLFCLIESFATIFYGYFQAKQKMEYQTYAETFQTILALIVGFFILFRMPSGQNLSYGYFVSSAIALAVLLWFFNRKIFRLNIGRDKAVWRKFLLISWPMALTGLFGTICTSMDSIMMGHWNFITETGWYNAAYKLVIVAMLPAGLISGSFFPVLSRFFKESKDKLQSLYDYHEKIMISLAIPLVVWSVFFAPRIIYMFYGSSFFPSVLAFQLLMVMVGFYFISRPLNDVLLASNQQKKVFLANFVGAMVNIILNLVLIPRYSLYGAAVSTIATYLTMFLLLFIFSLRPVIIKPLNRNILCDIIAATVASLLMGFVISQTFVARWNIFVSSSAAMFVYLVAFFCLIKAVKYFDYRYVKN